MGKRVPLLLASIVCAMITSGCVTREEFQIPADYVGWVSVEYENPDCPALPTSGGKRIINIPPSGTLCTSTPSPLATRWVRTYYVDNDSRLELRSTGWGEGGMIWAGSGPSEGTSIHGPVYPEMRFFVGTEEQFRETYESQEP